MTTAPASHPTRVVVVEDSDVQRAFIVRALESEGDIEVVGEAADARHAVTLVEQLRPDVVTVDLEIPGDGQRAIEQVMRDNPTPILVVSGRVADSTSPGAIDALMAGALEALPKPARWGPSEGADLRRRVRALKRVAVVRHPRGRSVDDGHSDDGPSVTVASAISIVGLAASTGGPPALAQVLGDLEGLDVPVLVVQHIHADFTEGLVAWMARATTLPVCTAVQGQTLERGVVYVGPGGFHLKVGPGLTVLLDPRPETVHRPSADALFSSMADQVGSRGLGVVLTGMGDDGAKGLLALRRKGGLTIAQDEATSAVFGMPRAAQLAGGAVRIVPLPEIGPSIMAATKKVAP